jgi:nicotinamidase-related amidase
MEIALVFVDIQNDYFPAGKNPLYNPEKAAENAGIALELFRKENLPIIHIQQISLQEGSTFFYLIQTDGKEIHNNVKLKNGETILIKHKPDSFFKQVCMKILKK